MQNLRIALDVWKISISEPTGIINLKRLLAHAVSLLAKDEKINLCFTGSISDKNWIKNNGLLENSCFQIFRIPGKLQKPMSALRLLPFGTPVARSDIFHSFTNYPFSSKGTTVVGTLIDFVPLMMPDYVPLEYTENQHRWCKWAAQHPQTSWIAISERTKQDAISLSCLDKEQITTLNLCAEDEMFKQPPAIEINSTLKKYNIDNPFLLCVSDLNPRKNHVRLLEAWIRGDFAERGWMMILAGLHSDNPIAQRIREGEFKNVLYLGYLPTNELTHLYYGCDGFVYPSLYEGFGLPVVDAIVAGKAVLTSRDSPMSDMVGSGAFIIDPFDVNNISWGLGELISNSKMREKMSAENWMRRGEFSISRLANDLFDAYSDIHNNFRRI